MLSTAIWLILYKMITRIHVLRGGKVYCVHSGGVACVPYTLQGRSCGALLSPKQIIVLISKIFTSQGTRRCNLPDPFLAKPRNSFKPLRTVGFAVGPRARAWPWERLMGLNSPIMLLHSMLSYDCMRENGEASTFVGQQ